jgi:REP-associated tyrosine transposase
MFRRKRNRLPPDAYIGQRWYFLTLNAEDRQQILAGERVVTLLLGTLRAACAEHFFDIYAYCFMPDHIHVEAVGLAPQSSLLEFIRAWKGTSTVPLRRLSFLDPLQKGYWDHILRPSDNRDAVAWYIFNNPVRKGLVKDPRQWPYSGSWMFDWKKAVAPPEEFVPPWKRSWRGKPAATATA